MAINLKGLTIKQPGNYFAAAKDGNVFNSHLDNLEWRPRKGVYGFPRGTANTSAKLTEAQALEIRRLYLEDMTQTYASLAKRYGMSISAVSAIVWGKTWTHIEEKVNS